MVTGRPYKFTRRTRKNCNWKSLFEQKNADTKHIFVWATNDNTMINSMFQLTRVLHNYLHFWSSICDATRYRRVTKRIENFSFGSRMPESYQCSVDIFSQNDVSPFPTYLRQFLKAATKTPIRAEINFIPKTDANFIVCCYFCVCLAVFWLFK